MDEFDCLHSYLSGFKRVIGVGAEFTSISLSIAIADGIAMAAHWPTYSREHLNPCSTTRLIATIRSINQRINKKQA